MKLHVHVYCTNLVYMSVENVQFSHTKKLQFTLAQKFQPDLDLINLTSYKHTVDILNKKFFRHFTTDIVTIFQLDFLLNTRSLENREC